MSDDILSRQLRPKSLDQMIGQESIVASLRNQIASGRIPKFYIFSGEPGSGKTTLAKILAVAIQKDDYTNFGALTDEDWKLADSYDIADLNASDANGVDAIRDLVAKAQYMPMTGRYKVVILDEAHRLTGPAQNVLLTPTENATSTIWIICTTDPDKIIEALHRRATKFRMQPLNAVHIQDFLYRAIAAAGYAAPPDFERVVDAVVQSGITSSGVILQALEKYLTGSPVQEALVTADPEYVGKELCRALLAGNWTPLQQALMKMQPDEIRQLRYIMLGYMRRVCVGNNGQSQRAADLCLYLGSSDAPMDDVSHAAWLTAKLFKCCAPTQPHYAAA